MGKAKRAQAGVEVELPLHLVRQSGRPRFLGFLGLGPAGANQEHDSKGHRPEMLHYRFLEVADGRLWIFRTMRLSGGEPKLSIMTGNYGWAATALESG